MVSHALAFEKHFYELSAHMEEQGFGLILLKGAYSPKQQKHGEFKKNVLKALQQECFVHHFLVQKTQHSARSFSKRLRTQAYLFADFLQESNANSSLQPLWSSPNFHLTPPKLKAISPLSIPCLQIELLVTPPEGTPLEQYMQDLLHFQSILEKTISPLYLFSTDKAPGYFYEDAGWLRTRIPTFIENHSFYANLLARFDAKACAQQLEQLLPLKQSTLPTVLRI